MPLNSARVRQYLKDFDFPGLFTQELGWDRHKATLDVTVDGCKFTLLAVAQKRGMVAFQCPAPDGEAIPLYSVRRKIEQQVAKSVHEHLVIFTDAGLTTQVWQWVKREAGRPAACREHTFHRNQPGDALIQKLQALEVTLEEEESLTIVDAVGKVKAAFDVDKVTKRFYDRFQKEHAIFLKFVKGIPSEGDRAWYASLMLNRLMFVYFIQKKGFLDGDLNYLRNRLQMMQARKGKDKFLSFYRHFLLRLFHDGLNTPKSARSAELDALLGKVPYLNGGLFDVHQLEEHNPEIAIPDQAFEKLFDFFDGYQWHLDERPLRADNEINPDVLGYIFEKYVNQKQMGAYYTKEDITEYIGKNTIIPWLFDAAEKKCAIAFRPDSALWRLLRDDPDRYIYPAVRHGVVRDFPSPSGRGAGGQGELVPESELPDFVQTGMHDPNARMSDKRFNLAQAPAGDPIRLPTETWREYMYRRNRCLELRRKLAAGEVHQINDLITLNLDIRQFAQDAIESCEGPELLRAFYHAITSVSVLDPTCGSGAFLFAALNILEPLYEACLARMQAFLDELERSDEKASPKKFDDFRKTLSQVNLHPNLRYFILKSIIIQNLYGVDIMEEAVEICKLRLFLKLVAQVERVDQIEPLPDIDFNIRAGNTLVGYVSLDEIRKAVEQEGKAQMKFVFSEAREEVARIEEAAEIADRAYQQFRAMQTEHGMNAGQFAQAKVQLRMRLNALAAELDRYLAREYGVDPDSKDKFVAWRTSHQPFHWFAEFYGIIRRGGFDVIIGNPPYVSSAKVRKQYTVKHYATDACTDIYAWVLERVAEILEDRGSTGMIVPLSLGFSGDFDCCRRFLFQNYAQNWFSSFGRIPSALFSFDVRVRNTIHLARRGSVSEAQHSGRLYRWFEQERPHLFQMLTYAQFRAELWDYRVPKLNTTELVQAFERCVSQRRGTVEDALTRGGRHSLFFKKTAYNWLNFCRRLPPCYDEQGRAIEHTEFGAVFFDSAADRDLGFLLLNGKIAFAFWIAIGDDFHVTKWMFADLPMNPARIGDTVKAKLVPIAGELDAAMKKATSFKLNAGKKVGNYNLALCRNVTDQSDAIFAREFGFDAVWDDVQLLYVQVVRTSFAAEDE